METAPQPETNRQVADRDEDSSAPTGLRERKKRETRRTISDAAVGLFDRQGFHSTTIAQIAAAANVAPRTVSSYFPVKEELAFPDQHQMRDALAERLAKREPGLTALAALRGWIDSSMPKWEREADEMRTVRRVIEAEPELRAYERLVVGEIADVLRAEIARDLGRDQDDLEPRMAAAATMAVFEVLGDHFKRGPGLEGDAGAATDAELHRGEVDRQIDRAIRFVSAGIEAMDDSPGGAR